MLSGVNMRQEALPEPAARAMSRGGRAPSPAALERLGRRLAAALRALFERLPAGAGTVRSAAEYLGVDRNVCQRTLSAIRPDRSGLEVLSVLPALGQMRRVVESAMRRLPAGRSSSARSALKALERAIRDFGGTPIRFRRAVRSLGTAATEPAQRSSAVTARQRLHADAVAIAGADLALRFHTIAVHPADGEAREVYLAHATGFIGQEIRKGAMPASSTTFLAERGSSTGPVPAARSSALPPLGPGPELLRAFCSEGLVLTREPKHRLGVAQVIDASVLPDGACVDVVYAGRDGPIPSPVHAPDDPNLSLNVTLRVPARRLVLDVYVHRAVAAHCLASGGAFVWNPLITGPRGNPNACWHCELPDQPRLELIGPGLRHGAIDAWSRYEELVSHLFGRLDWNLDDTVGYRLDVHYPIWGMIYCINLDGQAALRRSE